MEVALGKGRLSLWGRVEGRESDGLVWVEVAKREEGGSWKGVTRKKGEGKGSKWSEWKETEGD